MRWIAVWFILAGIVAFIIGLVQLQGPHDAWIVPTICLIAAVAMLTGVGLLRGLASRAHSRARAERRGSTNWAGRSGRLCPHPGCPRGRGAHAEPCHRMDAALHRLRVGAGPLGAGGSGGDSVVGAVQLLAPPDLTPGRTCTVT